MLAEVRAVNDRIFFVPGWVRWTAFLLILCLFGGALYLLARVLQDPTRADWVAPALSLAQVGGVAALAFLVMFFVERGQSAPRLSALTDTFLTVDVPRHLRQIAYEMSAFQPWSGPGQTYERLNTRTTIEISHNTGSHTAYYLIAARERAFALAIEANVKRFNVVIFFAHNPDAPPETVPHALEDTFAGAASAGYHVGKVARARNLNAPAGFPWTDVVMIPLHLNRPNGYLYDTMEREHVAQDLSIMIRGFLTEGVETALLAPSRGA